VEQITIGSWDGHTPWDYDGTSNLLNALNLPATTRRAVVEVAGDLEKLACFVSLYQGV